MKRCTVITGFLFCGVLLLSGCRAFDSTYASPEPEPEEVKMAASFSKDVTPCETPSNVKVTKNKTTLLSNTGWAATGEEATVTVKATKKKDHSATISMQKVLADKSTETLSFTVKQTGVDKFSACDFKFSEANGHPYEFVSGTVMLDQVNTTFDDKPGIVINSGSFDLIFTHDEPKAITATKVQSVYLGSEAANILASTSESTRGTFFVDWVTDATAQ